MNIYLWVWYSDKDHDRRRLLFLLVSLSLSHSLGDEHVRYKQGLIQVFRHARFAYISYGDVSSCRKQPGYNHYIMVRFLDPASLDNSRESRLVSGLKFCCILFWDPSTMESDSLTDPPAGSHQWSSLVRVLSVTESLIITLSLMWFSFTCWISWPEVVLSVSSALAASHWSRSRLQSS